MSEERVLIVGAAGMLGSAVLRAARAQAVAHLATTRDGRVGERLDLVSPSGVEAVVRTYRPSCIINCGGITKARSEDVVCAWLTNAAGPHLLAAAADAHGARLVHVSTDCVFRGEEGPYSEGRRPDAVDVYGRSKQAGEVTRPPHLTVRTSFIGWECGTAHGLLEWFVKSPGAVSGYTNHLWSGLTADIVARALLKLASMPEVTGLLHLHGREIDKGSLLAKLREALRLEKQITLVQAPEAVDRRLVSNRLESLGLGLETLDEGIEELARLRPVNG
jgi:dTDP-4-dehydrorhamnose reductase